MFVTHNNAITHFFYVWDGFKLLHYYHGEHDAWYSFHYEEGEIFQPFCFTVTSGPLVNIYGKKRRYNLDYDHIGSLVEVSTKGKELSKDIINRIRYNSFGVILSESNPYLQLPIGFTGGLRNHLTGFTRLGFRDYDPLMGRFTCPDPAKDMRGDADLYDYCSDDPINKVDMTGLNWEKLFEFSQPHEMMYKVDIADHTATREYYDEKEHTEKYRIDNVIKEAMSNLPSSTLAVVKDTAGALINPIDTMWNMSNVATGLIGKAFGVNNEFAPQAEAVTNHFSNRFFSGSENLKDEFKKHPVGVISDVLLFKPTKESIPKTFGKESGKTKPTNTQNNIAPELKSKSQTTLNTENNIITPTHKVEKSPKDMRNNIDKPISTSKRNNNSSEFDKNEFKRAKNYLTGPGPTTNSILEDTKKKKEQEERQKKDRGYILK